ncbi:putative membrane protein [Vibrio harveyi]|nr:putative membrane protein [Vibrio harveyi]
MKLSTLKNNVLSSLLAVAQVLMVLSSLLLLPTVVVLIGLKWL